ncbi:esterase/lipase family protein [Acinetobacter pragensis]|uniref:esterase/lipase family protein n=1 Tax=Acinetobacter pragensis TaxID=1806892 RepID=UPI00333EDA56
MLALARNQFILISLFSMSLLQGCQLVTLKEDRLSSSLNNKTDNILTNQQLSSASQHLLLMVNETGASCLSQLENCIAKLRSNETLDSEQIYAAASELYLARALGADQHHECKKDLTQQLSKLPPTKIKLCLDQQLADFDLSLRYSYVYLFKSEQPPESRLFDLRQGQVRTFYNVALSRLITTSYTRFNFQQLPESLMLGASQYNFDYQYYPALEHAAIEKLQSSYNLNFSGLNVINRQEGIGSEFVLVKKPKAQGINQRFILDPEHYYQDKANPNIHEARYLSVSATAAPSGGSSIDEILSLKAPLNITLYNPYQHKTADINSRTYTLTANYSVPYGLWLSENKLGKSGYWTLLNKEDNLRMPHIFMLEPYQPNKKVIVMIHGLASSPETWISLTNNIMGDQKLRDNYQVWQVFYSTNMPIFESRFQINALLKQAFAAVQPNTSSTKDAVLIGHSMGGIISRLLVSDADISAQAIPLMNYEQNMQLQRNPIIRERFVFKPIQPISRAIFIAAPHHGTAYADRWFTNLAKKMVVLPLSFLNDVNVQIPNSSNSTAGLVKTGPADLSQKSRFMLLTSNVLPSSSVPYHSIMGNQAKSHLIDQMSDGIVPYQSSHLDGAVSEKVITGGHSIHESPDAILELRRILREHLEQNKSANNQ